MPVVLMASSDKALQDFYTTYFADLGITTVQRDTQQQTLTCLETDSVPDVLLLDLPLPDGNGRVIVQHLRSQPVQSATQVVLLLEDRTSYLSRLRMGIEHILYKPISFPELGEYITNLVATRKQGVH